MDIDEFAKASYKTAKNIIGIGSSPKKALWNSVKYGTMIGGTLSLGLAGYETARAQRGEVIPTMGGSALGLISYPAVATATGASIIGGAAALGFSTVGLGLAAGVAALFLDVAVTKGAVKGIRYLSDVGRQIRHFETGGNYKDTRVAQNLRYQAAYEMSGATGSARNYLGREAAFLHR